MGRTAPGPEGGSRVRSCTEAGGRGAEDLSTLGSPAPPAPREPPATHPQQAHFELPQRHGPGARGAGPPPP